MGVTTRACLWTTVWLWCDTAVGIFCTTSPTLATVGSWIVIVSGAITVRSPGRVEMVMGKGRVSAGKMWCCTVVVELLLDGKLIEEDTRSPERDADADAVAEPAEATAVRRVMGDPTVDLMPRTGEEVVIVVTDAGAIPSCLATVSVKSLLSSASPDVTVFDCICCWYCCGGYWLLAVKDIVCNGFMEEPLMRLLLMKLKRPSGSGEAIPHTMQVLSSSSGGNCGWRFMSWIMNNQVHRGERALKLFKSGSPIWTLLFRTIFQNVCFRKYQLLTDAPALFSGSFYTY